LVYGYTCNFVTQLKLKCHAFPNNTFPFITSLKHEKSRIHNPLPSLVINDDVIINMGHVESEK
jgi:hypothetical protein